jgi:glutamate/tyrosine decarboxylase-like PLP-dependent enzyme
LLFGRYGAEKLQGMIRHHIALGQWFAQQVEADGRFEVVVPPRFGLTCFRLKGADDALNKQLMEAVNAEGECSKTYQVMFGVQVCACLSIS